MAHPNALNAKLGHAASIGGAAYVERAAFSDEVMGKLVAMDPLARKKALAIVNRAIEKSRASPPVRKPPSRNERVKIRWTDELIARFKQTAPWVKDNKALARRLGFPAYCEGSMKMARHRYLTKAAATRKGSAKPHSESPAPALRLAA